MNEQGSCIPHYFCFSITFSTLLIHYYTPCQCNLLHKPPQSLMYDTLTFASSDWPCLFDGHMINNPHVYSSPFSYIMHPPWPDQSQIITLCGQALTIASLQMSLVLAFLFTICICLAFASPHFALHCIALQSHHLYLLCHTWRQSITPRSHPQSLIGFTLRLPTPLILATS